MLTSDAFTRIGRCFLAWLTVAVATVATVATVAILPLAARAAPAEPINLPPGETDWRALSRLPDWSGVWVPNVTDQFAQLNSNVPPWTPATAKQMAFLEAEEMAGRPLLLLAGCLPTGMPSWMLISHNALEILFTPGRVTLLGEGDGNRMRRIYTDGRGHPDDPDLTLHGHSVGHWERDTLVVDTIGIVPQAWIAISEAVGIPNGGDMRISERFRLTKPDYLEDELTISAPKVLGKPWKTTRGYFRHRARREDIVEGVCAQGAFVEGVDQNNNPIFVPIPQSGDGRVVPRSP